MNIDINIPEITILRREVEQKAKITPRTASDFISLTDKINANCSERLSQSTIERLWQYSTRNKSAISLYTLDLLSRYIGRTDFADFKKRITEKNHPESKEFTDNILDINTLKIGDRLRLAWLPNRIMTITYLGNNRFEVSESINTSIRPGDTFECLQIAKELPLYLDRYNPVTKEAQNDPTSHRYVIGKNSGLTSIEKLP